MVNKDNIWLIKTAFVCFVLLGVLVVSAVGAEARNLPVGKYEDTDIIWCISGGLFGPDVDIGDIDARKVSDGGDRVCMGKHAPYTIAGNYRTTTKKSWNTVWWNPTINGEARVLCHWDQHDSCPHALIFDYSEGGYLTEWNYGYGKLTDNQLKKNYFEYIYKEENDKFYICGTDTGNGNKKKYGETASIGGNQVLCVKEFLSDGDVTYNRFVECCGFNGCNAQASRADYGTEIAGKTCSDDGTWVKSGSSSDNSGSDDEEFIPTREIIECEGNLDCHGVVSEARIENYKSSYCSERFMGKDRCMILEPNVSMSSGRTTSSGDLNINLDAGDSTSYMLYKLVAEDGSVAVEIDKSEERASDIDVHTWNVNCDGKNVLNRERAKTTSFEVNPDTKKCNIDLVVREDNADASAQAIWSPDEVIWKPRLALDVVKAPDKYWQEGEQGAVFVIYNEIDTYPSLKYTYSWNVYDGVSRNDTNEKLPDGTVLKERPAFSYKVDGVERPAIAYYPEWTGNKLITADACLKNDSKTCLMGWTRVESHSALSAALLGKGKDLGDGNCENGLGNKYYTECEGSKLKYYEYWNGRCLERTTSCAGGCSAGVCKDPEPEPKPTCENQGKVWCAEDSCTLKYTGYESDDPNKVCCGSKSCYEIKDASGIAKITAAHILNNDPLNIRSSDCSDEVRSGEFVVEWNAISDNISSVSIAILRCDNDNCDVSRTLMGERITNVRGGSEVLSGNYYITSSDTEAVSANAFSGPKQYGRVYARLLAQTSDGTYSSEYLLDGRVNRVPCVKYSVTTPTKDRIFDGAHDIAFDASESSDDDGETLTYKWEFYPGRECSNNLSSGTLVGSDVQMSFKPSGDGCMVLTASDYAISNKYSQYVRENPVAADLASKREACSNAGGFICWEAYSGCFDLETEEFVNSVEGIGTIGFAGKCCAPEYECRSKFLSPPWIGALDDLDGDRLEYSACSLMGDNSVCYTIYESSVDTDGYCQEDKCCAAELSGDNVSKTCSLDVDCGAEASKCEDGKYYLSDPLISECAGNCTCNYEWLYVGTDEDADGIDYECGDSECDRSPVVVDATKTEIEEDCEDTLDNDCDGFTDADDSDCEVTNGGGDLDPGNGGDSNFFSDEVCTGITDCDSWGDYPMCILNRCATPGQELKDYVIDGYETEDCANIECLGCESGYLHPTIIGYHLDDYDFDVEFCSGCSLDSHVFPCNKGYVCELGMCVEDSEYVGPGTPDHETDCLDGIDNDEDGLVDYYDVEECVACGNNLLEPEQGEACDDGNLVNGDGCTENCTVEVIPGCGNGLIEPDIGETCEGDNYGGVTCAEVVGFVSGNITCSDECTLDTSVCVPVYVAECGNAILDEGEECDGTVGLDYLACSDFEGYDKGNVSCMTNCTYNISACSESKDAVVVNDPARISNSGSSGNGGGSLSTDDDSAITPVDPGISLKATCSSVDKPDVGDWSICLDGNKYRDIPICNEAAGTWELQEESGTCSVSSRSSSSSLMWLWIVLGSLGGLAIIGAVVYFVAAKGKSKSPAVIPRPIANVVKKPATVAAVTMFVVLAGVLVMATGNITGRVVDSGLPTECVANGDLCSLIDGTSGICAYVDLDGSLSCTRFDVAIEKVSGLVVQMQPVGGGVSSPLVPF